MKNIAIPLLLAGSAKAEAKKKAAMAADYAYPEPILIATAWTGDVCVDKAGAVKAKLALLGTALKELETEEAGRAALATKETEAMKKRTDAIAAVLKQDETMKADVAANNNKITALLGLKDALDEANLAAAVGSQLKATAKETEGDKKNLLDTAKINYEGDANATPNPTTGSEGVWTGYKNQLKVYTDLEADTASVAGSKLYMQAKQTLLSVENCNAGAAVGALGDGETTGTNGFQAACAVNTTSLAQDKTAIGDTLATKTAPASAGARLDLQTAADAEAAAYLLYAEYKLIARYLGWAQKEAFTNINDGYMDPGTIEASTPTSTSTQTTTITVLDTHYRISNPEWNRKFHAWNLYNGGVDADDATAANITNAKIKVLSATQLHTTFKTNSGDPSTTIANTASRTNLATDAHTILDSAKTGDPIFKNWLLKLRKTWGNVGYDSTAIWVSGKKFDGKLSGAAVTDTSAETNLHSETAAGNPTTALSGTGLATYGETAWISESQTFMTKAKDYIDAVWKEDYSDPSQASAITAMTGSEGAYKSAFTVLAAGTCTVGASATLNAQNFGTTLTFVGGPPTYGDGTGLKWANTAGAGGTNGWATATGVTANAMTRLPAEARTEGMSLCAQLCIDRPGHLTGTGVGTGGAWVFNTGTAVASESNTAGTTTAASSALTYLVPKYLTDALSGATDGVFGASSTSTDKMGATTHCTGMSIADSTTTGAEGTNCKLTWGDVPASPEGGGNGLCYVRTVANKAKALGDAIGGATPTVFTATSSKCTFVVSDDGTPTTLSSTANQDCTAPTIKFNWFEFAIQKWGDAYGDLIDAEATFRVADWYYQKISLMYGKVYGDVLDNSPPSATAASVTTAGYCTSFIALQNSSGDRTATSGESNPDDKIGSVLGVSACARAMLRNDGCVGGDGYFSYNAKYDTCYCCTAVPGSGVTGTATNTTAKNEWLIYRWTGLFEDHLPATGIVARSIVTNQNVGMTIAALTRTFPSTAATVTYNSANTGAKAVTAGWTDVMNLDLCYNDGATPAIITSATFASNATGLNSACGTAAQRVNWPTTNFATQLMYRKQTVASGIVTTKDYGFWKAYTNAETDYNTKLATYNTKVETYDDRLISIATAEANWKYARGQWLTNTRLVNKWTTLVAVSNTDNLAFKQAKVDANQAYVDAQAAYNDATKNMTRTQAEIGNSTTLKLGFTVAETNAKKAYDDAYAAIYQAAATGKTTGTNVALGTYKDGGTGALGTLFGLRKTAGLEYTALDTATKALDKRDLAIADAQSKYDLALAAHVKAIVECKVENYNLYKDALDTAVGERATDLKTILALVTKAEEAAPARGAAGARCEKALSNGTFRPARGETTCNEGLCCGAAQIPDSKNVVMTIETCQTVGTTSYDYAPARAPMATKAPAAKSYDFVCIEGAKKLAAAASALATAVYMLA